jgi:hypothetical protein
LAHETDSETICDHIVIMAGTGGSGRAELLARRLKPEEDCRDRHIGRHLAGGESFGCAINGDATL